jgi:hypothetical protein
MPDTRLDIADLEALSEEASRQNLSLACLIAAMESGEPIAWMEEYGAAKAND